MQATLQSGTGDPHLLHPERPMLSGQHVVSVGHQRSSEVGTKGQGDSKGEGRKKESLMCQSRPVTC